MNEQISVIIPVYNAEQYLSKCIESVTAQTCSDLQIILVDDGSTDASGHICDKYAAEDSRITVIHKKNGGVSSARNVGLKAAAGEWIGFVDADDWIEADMFAYLLENANRYCAEISLCALWEEAPGQRSVRGVDRVSVLTSTEAMEQLLRDDQVNNFLWNKLWRKELFCDISFPEGRTFEDVAVAYKLFERASTVVCLPEIKYHYLQHSSSIMDNPSLKNKADFYFAVKQRMIDLEPRWAQYSELLQASCVASAVGVWAAYCCNDRKTREKYAPVIREIAAFSRGRRALVYKHMRLGRVGNLIVRLTAYPRKWAFVCAAILGRVYKRKHGRNI